MRSAEWINLLFFSYLLLLSLLRPFAPHRRVKALAEAAAGIGIIWALPFMVQPLGSLRASIIRDWVPALLLLLAYWTAGQFSLSTNQRFQSKLERFDRKIFCVLGNVTSARWHLLIAEYLELTYLLCYPLIPLGLGMLYIHKIEHHADNYWTMVLLPTYLCYATLPFLQTLPPRLLKQDIVPSLPHTTIRSFNLWILKHGSITMNTFPSAHVAATLATSLALLELLPSTGIGFLLVSLSLAVGAVLGRYHYAADVLIGAILATAFFFMEI